MFRNLKFTPRAGLTRYYAHTHLLWRRLPQDGLLELGFSTGTVTLQGRELGALLQALVVESVWEVTAVPERHASESWHVSEILFRDH